MFLDAFRFPDADAEYAFFMQKRANCYTSFYPFQTFAGRLSRLDFEPITVLSGSNGSGKTTALNVIAEKLRLNRAVCSIKPNFFRITLTNAPIFVRVHCRRRARSSQATMCLIICCAFVT